MINCCCSIWKCSAPHLLVLLDELRAFIRTRRLKVNFKWIPREENAEADLVASEALKSKADVTLESNIHHCQAIAEDGEDDVQEVPVKRQRRRGRPKQVRPVDFRRERPKLVLPEAFSCLCCDGDGAPSHQLPMYCSSCYERLLIEGYQDPTEDLALVYFLWHGRHLQGVGNETARRVNETAHLFRIDYNEKRATKYLLYALVHGEWRVVP